MLLFAPLTRLKTDLDALRPLAPEQEQQLLQQLPQFPKPRTPPTF